MGGPRRWRVAGVFGRLVGVLGWIAGFVREVDRGIAVGRGYVPVSKNVRLARRVGCGLRAPGGRVRANRAGRRGCGGRV